MQGILRGTASGDVVLEKVMSDEQVQPGENVLTSGGDLVFPKGMPVGTVVSVDKGSESFLNIRLKPAANLAKLEEVKSADVLKRGSHQLSAAVFAND